MLHANLEPLADAIRYGSRECSTAIIGASVAFGLAIIFKAWIENRRW